MKIVLSETLSYCFGVRKTLEMTDRLLADRPDRTYLHAWRDRPQRARRRGPQGQGPAHRPDPRRRPGRRRRHPPEPRLDPEALSRARRDGASSTSTPPARWSGSSTTASARSRPRAALPSSSASSGTRRSGASSARSPGPSWSSPPTRSRPISSTASAGPASWPSRRSSRRRPRRIVERIRALVPDVVYHDTICQPTKTRQREVETHTRKADCVIVIGSRHSANTMHLYNIARAINPRTHLIDRPESVEDIAIPAGRDRLRGLRSVDADGAHRRGRPAPRVPPGDAARTGRTARS